MQTDFIRQVLSIVAQRPFPSGGITEKAHNLYKQALDTTFSWRGDWRVLLQALEHFLPPSPALTRMRVSG